MMVSPRIKASCVNAKALSAVFETPGAVTDGMHLAPNGRVAGATMVYDSEDKSALVPVGVRSRDE